MALLEKEKIDLLVTFRNVNVFWREKEKIYEDSLSFLQKKMFLENYVIYSNQINKDDFSNLLAWAQSLEDLTKTKKVKFF